MATVIANSFALLSSQQRYLVGGEVHDLQLDELVGGAELHVGRLGAEVAGVGIAPAVAIGLLVGVDEDGLLDQIVERDSCLQ